LMQSSTRLACLTIIDDSAHPDILPTLS
jgi:hypothetical protein